MADAFICDAIRTPIGRYAGALSSIRADDLAAIPIKALIDRNPGVDWSELDDVILGCANQAGEDNRNLAHGWALRGLPDSSGGCDPQPCAVRVDAVAMARSRGSGRRIRPDVAGGSESMSPRPSSWPGDVGLRPQCGDVHPPSVALRQSKMKSAYGDDTMPSTGENVAQDFQVSRADHDAFALRARRKPAAAQATAVLTAEIAAVEIPQRKGDPTIVDGTSTCAQRRWKRRQV